ncbi:unnamed protein product [Lactuca virosa]|uniref:Uncharacterized protein n=1 Tax=Lactuca virosa TaxID=75947 RepID=A0AAU9MH26_9ASTR|nr:unnamed protein product [Lactuca virosa]
MFALFIFHALQKTHEENDCPNYQYEDGVCGHFKRVDEEEFKAFEKQLNLEHRDIEYVMLLKLIVGRLVSILVCLVVVVIKM